MFPSSQLNIETVTLTFTSLGKENGICYNILMRGYYKTLMNFSLIIKHETLPYNWAGVVYNFYLAYVLHVSGYN
jgi:hypothetical protein